MKKYLLIMLLSFQASAVVINDKGLGEFLLVPYYTVNNDLNTLVSITNTKDQPKAVKINFREGLNGHAVLSYNVYIDAHDVWTFALVATNSTVFGYDGQPSALHVTSDLSCAPFLPNSGQEFLPFELTDGPDSMQRVREGYIEIIEMAEVSDSIAETLEFTQGTSLSENCNDIANAWASGFWSGDIGDISPEEMAPITGGLMAEASVIDVAQGINYSIPVTALADFFPDDSIVHSSPGDTGLSLDAAKPGATIITENGAYQLSFDSGIDAVSAVFMSNQLLAPFELLSILAAQSETIFVQPTRRFYLNDDNLTATAPFPVPTALNCSADTYGGSALTLNVFDREGNEDGNEVTIPTPATEGVCGSVFVQSISSDSAVELTTSNLTGSSNFDQVRVDLNRLFSESGFIKSTPFNSQSISATNDADENVQIWGLPMLGLSLQKFTNANAQPGVLAQYGSAHKIKATTRITTD